MSGPPDGAELSEGTLGHDSTFCTVFIDKAAQVGSSSTYSGGSPVTNMGAVGLEGGELKHHLSFWDVEMQSWWAGMLEWLFESWIFLGLSAVVLVMIQSVVTEEDKNRSLGAYEGTQNDRRMDSWSRSSRIDGIS